MDVVGIDKETLEFELSSAELEAWSWLFLPEAAPPNAAQPRDATT